MNSYTANPKRSFSVTSDEYSSAFAVRMSLSTESSAAFKLCQQAISNCQELYLLEDTATPILQTDASEHGIGGYLYVVIMAKSE